MVSKRLRVVLDPTVLIGALLEPKGECGRLLRLVSEREIDLVLDEPVLLGLESALSDPVAQEQGSWSANDAQRWINALQVLAIYEEAPPEGNAEGSVERRVEGSEEQGEGSTLEQSEGQISPFDRRLFSLARRTGATLVSIDPDTLASSGSMGVDVLRPGTVSDVVSAKSSV